MATIDALKWRSTTKQLNEVKNRASFLKNLLYPDSRAQFFKTFTAELWFKRRARHVAPFVRRGSAGIMVKGGTEDSVTVSFPHIRIKRPMNPTDLLDKRRGGSDIYISEADMNKEIAKYMAEEIGYMDDDISHAEEYLVAQSLRGSISYVSEDEEAFSVTFPRDAGHTIVLTGTDLWTNAASKPRSQFKTAQQLIMDKLSLNTNLVILGSDAATAFVANADVKASLDNNFRLNFGSGLDLTAALDENGATFLGRYGSNNIPVWQYSRQVTLPDGTMYDLIRPDYAEFIANTPGNEWRMAYGPHADMKAIGEGKVLSTKRFSKMWEVEDPSARMHLATSNPLPWPKRPDASVSIKVV